jgi:glycosyltransferase involved in cell wall biosynthesis
MTIVQLMASPFLGGPERQMLGLARHLPENYRSVFLSFAEGGRCQALLEEAQRHGFEATALKHNAQRPTRAVAEIAQHLHRVRADVLCCSGYKPDILGWLAARRARVPVISISHGWTAATFKVRLNECLDRLVLRWMDCTVCVSEAQASRVRRAGIATNRITVIRNAVDCDSIPPPDQRVRIEMLRWFPQAPRFLIGAAGRLSPEKGFDQLVDAAAIVQRTNPEVGFVLFGDGPLYDALQRRIRALGLSETFLLAGFHGNVRHYLPNLDLIVLPSHTEGLPVIALEAMAAAVPLLATAVGGTPEVVADGVTGKLLPPGKPGIMAETILRMITQFVQTRAMGQQGRWRVEQQFTFPTQSLAYQRLFASLVQNTTPRGPLLAANPKPPTRIPTYS